MSPAANLTVDLHLKLDRFELNVAFESNAKLTAIFGASGCGKTSLLESLAGLRPGAHGTISWNGERWSNAPGERPAAPESRGIGYVPQEGLLFPGRSVRANLLAGAPRARARGLDVQKVLREAVDLLELGALLEQSVDTLSGGERQRVALGRALCSGPRQLLLDEPLSALDLPLRRKLLPFLHRIAHQIELPMLLVSHDPIEVQALAGHLVVLDQGQVIASGEPRRVLTRPEVFPLAHQSGFENILPARVLEQRATSSILQLDSGPTAQTLVTPRTQLAVGEGLLVGVPSNDIILAIQRPSQISARNVLPAHVVQVEAIGDQRLIRVLPTGGRTPLCVEVTAMTARDLELAQGRALFLLIKTVACQLYDSLPRSLDC